MLSRVISLLSLLIATAILQITSILLLAELLYAIALLLVDWNLVLGGDSDQIEELLVLLVRLNLFLHLRHLALVLPILLFEVVDEVAEIFNLLLHVAHFFLGLTRLLLQVHFELVILLLVLLKRLLSLIQLVFLHHDVLAQQFRLLCLLVDLDLSHEDLTGVGDEVTNGLLLLPTLVQVLNSPRFVLQA